VEFTILISLAVVNLYNELEGRQSKLECIKKGCTLDKVTFEMYSLVFIVASLFMLHFGIDAITASNLYELVAFMAVTTLMLGYGILKFFVTEKDIFDFVLITTVFVSEILYIILVYPIYRNYRWIFFKKVGGDTKFREMYQRWQQYKSILKFDLLFGILILITSGLFTQINFTAEQLDTKHEIMDLLLNLGTCLITVAVFVCGFFGVKKEIKSMMTAFFVLCTTEPIYIGFKLYDLRGDQNFAQFVVFAFLALVCRVTVVVFAVLCFKNFSKGLKNFEYLKQDKQQSFIRVEDDEEDDETSQPFLGGPLLVN